MESNEFSCMHAVFIPTYYTELLHGIAIRILYACMHAEFIS